MKQNTRLILIQPPLDPSSSDFTTESRDASENYDVIVQFMMSLSSCVDNFLTKSRDKYARFSFEDTHW